MVERNIVLPLYDNDGASLEDVHETFKRELLLRAGGYSATRQSGAWQDEVSGIVYVDESIVYTVLCSADADNLIVRTLPALRLLARQEAILTYSRIVDVQFISDDSKTA